MSRTGRLPVLVPAQVKFTHLNGIVHVEGPKGKLNRDFSKSSVVIEYVDECVTVKPLDESRFSKAMHGTVRSHINNMVKGVTEHFIENLEIHGAGFKAALSGKKLVLNLGFSSPREVSIPEDIHVTVLESTKVKIEGINKESVGKIAAEIFHLYKVEPYKGKGVRYTNRPVRRKEGKKAA